MTTFLKWKKLTKVERQENSLIIKLNYFSHRCYFGAKEWFIKDILFVNLENTLSKYFDDFLMERESRFVNLDFRMFNFPRFINTSFQINKRSFNSGLFLKLFS